MDSHPRAQKQVRERILEAAEERFRHYGYHKTTMAEIAGDCDMSAANLYRYFENKQDIAAACACRCFVALETRLREVLRRPGLNSSQRLEAFILAMLWYTHEQASEYPTINELVESLSRGRRDLVHTREAMIRSLIAEILAEGNRTQEFSVPDVRSTSGTVVTAIAVFGLPLIMGLYALSELEEMAKDVAGLLVRGLAKR